MPVTAITFDPRIDLPSGNLGSQPITLKATPTRIREVGTQTVYPETVTFSDVTADTPIHLQSTDGTWAWTIGAYRRLKIVDIRTVFVTGATANWVDLVDVDPDTFLPTDRYTTVGEQLAALTTGLAAAQTATQVATAISTALTGYIQLPPGGTEGQVLGLIGGVLTWVTPATGGTTTPDNAFVTDTGDFLVTDTGDYLIAA